MHRERVQLFLRRPRQRSLRFRRRSARRRIRSLLLLQTRVEILLVPIVSISAPTIQKRRRRLQHRRGKSSSRRMSREKKKKISSSPHFRDVAPLYQQHHHQRHVSRISLSLFIHFTRGLVYIKERYACVWINLCGEKRWHFVIFGIGLAR